MRLVNHIILDATSNKYLYSSQYWVLDLCLHGDTLLNSGDTNLLYTKLSYGLANKGNVNKKFKLHKRLKKGTPHYLYSRGYVVQHFAKYLQSKDEEARDKGTPHVMQILRHGTLNRTSNAHLLRKERSYTKLKYSRTPSYDIVSGGSAALLAGLFGFLISEKFGMELVDSGDFYYLFMYLVFVSLATTPLLAVTNVYRSFISQISIKKLFEFYTIIFIIFLKIFK